MVHALLGAGGKTSAREAGSSLGLGVVNGGHEDWVLAVALSDGQLLIAISCGTHSDTVTEPESSVRKVDELAHATTFWEIVVVGVDWVGVVRANANTSLVGWNGGDVESGTYICRLANVGIGTTTEEDLGFIVVVGSEG